MPDPMTVLAATQLPLTTLRDRATEVLAQAAARHGLLLFTRPETNDPDPTIIVHDAEGSRLAEVRITRNGRVQARIENWVASDIQTAGREVAPPAPFVRDEGAHLVWLTRDSDLRTTDRAILALCELLETFDAP